LNTPKTEGGGEGRTHTVGKGGKFAPLLQHKKNRLALASVSGKKFFVTQRGRRKGGLDDRRKRTANLPPKGGERDIRGALFLSYFPKHEPKDVLGRGKLQSSGGKKRAAGLPGDRPPFGRGDRA